MASVSATPSDPIGADTTVPSAGLPSGGSGKARYTEGGAVNNKAQYVKESTRSLLLWENPIQSAAVLVSILAASYIFTTYSPVRVIAFAVGAATFANLIFVNAWVYGGSLFTNAQAHGGVKKPPTMWFLDHANRQPLSHSFVREWSDLVVDVVNVSVSYLSSIVAVDDSKKSAEALLGIGFVYLLSGYISSGTLFLAATIVSFIAPRVYLANKTLIDGHAVKTRDLVNNHVQNISGAASKYYNNAATQAKIKIAQTKKVKKAE
ncbi:Reticulon-domain-containing protein [Powellomyces hirtus]|nr:Reticulon-domain-containing protein [Powellomyces hirtus]